MKFYKTLALGCKVNTYEIQAIKELLDKNGYQESHDDKCDVFIVNTCAVTQVGEQKSRQMIRKAIKKYPNATHVVMGCYSQLHPEIVKDIDNTAIILGTTNRSKIIELLNEYYETADNILKEELLDYILHTFKYKFYSVHQYFKKTYPINEYKKQLIQINMTLNARQELSYNEVIYNADFVKMTEKSYRL